ncbi:MAG: glycosyl hydrolase family 28 protein [Candidatus Brocadiia bacterium]
MPDRVTVYPAPEGVEPSPDYRLRADGREVFVHHCPAASYALLSLTGAAELEVEPSFAFEKVVVRPLSSGITPRMEDGLVGLTLKEPAKLSVELDGDLSRPLFIFADPPDEDAPSPDAPGVRFFEAGRVHEPGLMEPGSGETIYIEGGAVVRGAVLAESAEDVTVRGRGVLDGSAFVQTGRDRGPWLLRFMDCEGVRVEGIAAVMSPRWTMPCIGCRDVLADGVRIITRGVGHDGIDFVGCRDATARDCFIRTDDDCVAVKASTYRDQCGGQDVSGIRAEGCVLWDGLPGNALEIGYETRCDRMDDIAFRDCDIIHAEWEGYSSGAALSIHNGDRATITNVLYEDIRVEDAQQKLIDLKVTLDRYSRDEERGHVRGATLRNIHVVDGPFPPSIIQGYDSDHTVEDVTIENLTVRGRPVADCAAAKLVIEKARPPRFVVPGQQRAT